jgi:hypothetical protein
MLYSICYTCSSFFREWAYPLQVSKSHEPALIPTAKNSAILRKPNGRLSPYFRRNITKNNIVCQFNAKMTSTCARHFWELQFFLVITFSIHSWRYFFMAVPSSVTLRGTRRNSLWLWVSWLFQFVTTKGYFILYAAVEQFFVICCAGANRRPVVRITQ